MPRKYTKKKTKVKRGGTLTKTLSDGENIMNDEIIILKNRLDELEMKLEICCRDMVQGANTIQRMTRGHHSRKDTKIYKRGLKPNVTDALLDLPEDVGDLIASHIKTKTEGWTIIKNADAYPRENLGCFQGSNVKLDKLKQESTGFGGFVNCKTPPDSHGRKYTSGFVRCQADTPDILIDNIVRGFERRNGTEVWICDVYISPGASFKLLKQKEIEGFEFEYDEINKK